jgi:hypothetical protein
MDGRYGRVLSVSSGRVKVDFNHPLSGRVLAFEMEVNEKISDDVEKIKNIFEAFTKQKIDEVKVNGKEVEIRSPPMVDYIIKKKIADMLQKFLGFEHVKYYETFDKATATPESSA